MSSQGGNSSLLHLLTIMKVQTQTEFSSLSWTVIKETVDPTVNMIGFISTLKTLLGEAECLQIYFYIGVNQKC